jgi:hypothetical protein
LSEEGSLNEEDVKVVQGQRSWKPRDGCGTLALVEVEIVIKVRGQLLGSGNVKRRRNETQKDDK